METRKVDGNEPATGFAIPGQEKAGWLPESIPGIPVRLLIAKDIMQAHVTSYVHAGFPYKSDADAKEALKDADALLKAYNNQ